LDFLFSVPLNADRGMGAISESAKRATMQAPGVEA
jgi:hypothetical protein